MEQIKLEVGKKYEIRGPYDHVAPNEQKEVEIIKVVDRPILRFRCEGSNRRWYTINGRVKNNRDSALDLVREVSERN